MTPPPLDATASAGSAAGADGDALRELVLGAAVGTFPPEDGGVTVVAPDATTGLHAVLNFTAHAVVATDRTLAEVIALGADGFGGACAPDVLRALAGPDGWIGVLDAVLVAPGTADPSRALAEVTDHDDHPRVRYARETRLDVRVLADEHGLVTLGTGIGGRTELGFELVEAPHPPGTGRRLLEGALAAVPTDEVVFASCAPGNARSLRSLLAAGFTPIGGEVLLRP